MRIFVLAGLPRIQFQHLDPLARSGPGAGIFTAFAANTILASTDVVGFTPTPSECFVTADRPNGPGVYLPAVRINRDAISSDNRSVYGEVAEGSRNDQRQGHC